MALKLVLFIVVLMHLEICVSQSYTNLCLEVSGLPPEVIVRDCMMDFVNKFPEEAEGFAEEGATQKQLDLAIDKIAKAVWDSKKIKDNWTNHTLCISNGLKKCYGIRNVRSSEILQLQSAM